MAELNPPLWLGDPSQEHSAENLRQMMAASFQNSEGFLGADDSFQVIENSAGADASVEVSAGLLFILGTQSETQGGYFLENIGSMNIPISLAASNERIDVIAAQVISPSYGGSSTTWAIALISGQESSTPVAPNLPPNSYALANVSVPTSGTITNARISDRRERLEASYTAANIEDGTIGESKIARHTIPSEKFQDGVILDEHLIDNSLHNYNFRPNSITAAKIGDRAIGHEELSRNVLAGKHFASGSVTADKILNSSVQNQHFADRSIGLQQMQFVPDGEISPDNIADGSVDVSRFATGAITGEKFDPAYIINPHLVKNRIDYWRCVEIQINNNDAAVLNSSEPFGDNTVAAHIINDPLGDLYPDIYPANPVTVQSNGSLVFNSSIFTHQGFFVEAWTSAAPSHGRGIYAQASVTSRVYGHAYIPHGSDLDDDGAYTTNDDRSTSYILEMANFVRDSSNALLGNFYIRLFYQSFTNTISFGGAGDVSDTWPMPITTISGLYPWVRIWF